MIIIIDTMHITINKGGIFLTYINFALIFIVCHALAYTIAGAICLQLSKDIYETKSRLCDFMRDMSDDKESKHVQVYFLPAQILRGLLMSIALYPLLGALVDLSFALKALSFAGLMFIFTHLAAVSPFIDNIEGFVYFRSKYFKLQGVAKFQMETGFTKKYVDWLTETITCKAIPLDQINTIRVDDYAIIVYGAGIHAGRMRGLKEFKRKAFDLNKKMIVFATGGAPDDKVIISKIRANNFTVEELESIEFFYFQSGLNYEQMGLRDKAMMKLYYKMLELKSNKSDIEDGTSKAMATSYDHSSSEQIKPMISYLNDLISNLDLK